MIKTDTGEYIVGAYLKVVEKCDVVDYNVRQPGGGLQGLGELDVIGLNFKTNTAILCEVTTHIRGLLYVDNKTTIKKIKDKHQRQIEYSKQYLKDFKFVRYMFWSPVVPNGYLTDELSKIETLELVLNKDYTSKITTLRQEAKEATNDVGNPFFRILQILEHLK